MTKNLYSATFVYPKRQQKLHQSKILKLKTENKQQKNAQEIVDW